MPIFTEPDLLLSILPQGWKVIQVRAEGKASNTLILNPQGKKFDSLEEVNDFLRKLVSSIDKEEEEFENLIEDKTKVASLALSERARMKRKYHAMKSPFRNLLKRTLEKNHEVVVCKKKKSYDYQQYLTKRKKERKEIYKGL